MMMMMMIVIVNIIIKLLWRHMVYLQKTNGIGKFCTRFGRSAGNERENDRDRERERERERD